MPAGRVTWKWQAGGFISSLPFLEGRGGGQRSQELGAGAQPRARRVQPAEGPTGRGRGLPGPHPNSEWKILGSEAGARPARPSGELAGLSLRGALVPRLYIHRAGNVYFSLLTFSK